MFHMECSQNQSYSITNADDIFSPEKDYMLSGGDKFPGSKRFVIIDKNVESIYFHKINTYFKMRDIKTCYAICKPGDKEKSIKNYIEILEKLCDFDVKRVGEPIIAIGGGVTTDIAGFIASTYRRGVPHIKVPTSLMGYVDASVGIKTGINFGPFKNRVGTFEFPREVLLYKEFLKTLDYENIINGVGEIVKLAIIMDCDLFDELEKNGKKSISEKFQNSEGEKILKVSILLMAKELSANIYEYNLCRKVDFGHTFSPVIESTSGYNIMHGKAVAIDSFLSVCIAYNRGLINDKELDRVRVLYGKLSLPMRSDIDCDKLWESVQERTLHRGGKQNIPLPHGIGKCTFINDLKFKEVEKSFDLVNKLI